MWTTRQWHKPSTENAETCDEMNHICGAWSEHIQGKKTISFSRGQEFMKLGSTPTGIFIENIPTIPGWCLCAKTKLNILNRRKCLLIKIMLVLHSNLWRQIDLRGESSRSYLYDLTCLILWKDTRHKERMVHRNGPNYGRMIHRLWIPFLERMVPWDGFYC